MQAQLEPPEPDATQLCAVRVLLYSEWPDQLAELELRYLYQGLEPAFSVFGMRQGVRYGSSCWLQAAQVSQQRVQLQIQFAERDVGAQMFLTIAAGPRARQVVKLTRGLVQVSLGMVYKLQQQLFKASQRSPRNPGQRYGGEAPETPTIPLRTYQSDERRKDTPGVESLQYSVIERASAPVDDGGLGTPQLIKDPVERTKKLLRQQEELQRRLDGILQDASGPQ